MLGVGEKFPDYSVTATVSLDKDKAFTTITDKDYAGKWKVYFFWPKDFTFVCPTEIAAFGKLNKEFARPRYPDPGRQHRFRVRAPRVAHSSRRSERPAVPHAGRHQA